MILDETLRNRKIQKDLERKQADQILNEMLEDQNIKEMFIRKMNQFFLEGQI